MSKAPRDDTEPKLGTPCPAPSECEPDGHLFDDQTEGPAPPLSDWPLRSYLELGALPSAVPCARLHTKQVLWEWGAQALIDPTELIVSELVTNALHASRGLTASRYAGRSAPEPPPLRLWLHAHQQQIAIQVWDGSDQLPIQWEADLDAESGRGLLLVASLQRELGLIQTAESSGKMVWAVVHENHRHGIGNT